MFGIGFFEIILIIFVVLIFIKPKDLPNFIRSIGRFYSQIRNAYLSVLRAINSYNDEVKNMIQLDTKIDEEKPVAKKAKTGKKGEKKSKSVAADEGITNAKNYKKKVVGKKLASSKRSGKTTKKVSK